MGSCVCALVRCSFFSPAISLLHFKNAFPVMSFERKKRKSLSNSCISTCGCFQLFHPQYVPKSVLAYVKTTKNKQTERYKITKKKEEERKDKNTNRSSGGFFIFFKHYFTKKKLFSQYNRKKHKKDEMKSHVC